ncbi:hypothetical protein [Methylomonas rivi]|uniref:Gfo/Idh/MocA-like oxidoreductase N-terminal domain-containing protein n=1 Tax=Methylomonas rivi TaxID=2952226 RepID=A0ABT1U7W8_9GAMM|nr:hypothetical protein [Methylomonas sp. WSC-6]MCQ8129470.1 hypothetical protein [Methylomonas sp. WSC-6]
MTKTVARKKAKIILIGCGPHAKRIYLPALLKLREEGLVELCLIIDVKKKEDDVRSVVAKMGFETEMWFLDPFQYSIPDELSKRLSSFAQCQCVDGVLISTEPLVHHVYAEWALRNELSILMDKPITTRADVVSNLSNAKGILDDYIKLFNLYSRVQKKKETVFLVNSQRRFHPGFKFVENLLKEIGHRTNCPVTYMQAYHCDGQWRFPSEIVTQEYHPYCLGYGKASHSGYSIFDMLYRFYTAPGVESKIADTMEVVSSFVQPAGFIKQYTEADYVSTFGAGYNEVKKWSDDQLQQMCEDFGEIDLSSIITMKKDDVAIANLSVNLVHNGFARRTWLRPGNDLYKGNGRVKHEHFSIQQGPFQNIQIHSYQSNDVHDQMSGLEGDLGGNNHFDVFVFRNPLLSGSDGSLKVYGMSDILASEAESVRSTLVTETVKHRVVREFINYLNGSGSKRNLSSQIEDHLVTVQIMSGVYHSHILRKENSDCVVRMPYGRPRV